MLIIFFVHWELWFLIIVIGKFNAKSRKRWESDKSAIEGSKIEFVTFQFGPSQMIKEHTFFLENVSSCIDLILTNPVKMVVELVVHHSPHHHQIIVTKFTTSPSNNSSTSWKTKFYLRLNKGWSYLGSN